MLATHAPTPAFHPELVTAVRDEAGRAADRVAAFLHGHAEDGTSPSLSREVLLTLAAVLNLTAWERGGLALGRGLLAADGPAPDLPVRVLGLFVERTAWAARPHLHADVRLDAPDDDALIEALAQYLWASRARLAPEDAL